MGSIFRLMIVLVLLIAVAGGGGVYWFYLRSDKLLLAEALRQLGVMAPDLKFGIERANFDLSGRACLYGLSVTLPDDVEPSLYIPETVATLDQQQMTDFENVSIRRLQIVKPMLRAVRQADGRWNWQGIKFQSKAPTLPDIEIEHGTAVVELQRVGRATHKRKLNDLNLTALPAAARQMKIALSARIDPAGPLNVTADLNLDDSAWMVEAKWKSFPVDDSLLQLLSDVSPVVEEKLQLARRSMAELAAKQVAAVSINSRTVAAELASDRSQAMRLESRVQVPPQPPADFGLRCVCDLHARFRQEESGAPVRFQLLTELQSGQLSNPLLPFPLYELRGSLYVDDRQVIVRELRAENGSALLKLDVKTAASQPLQLMLDATGIEIDEPLKARLPESARKLLNSLSLTGLCDVTASSRQGEAGLVWDADLKLSKATVVHEKFPYPVREVSGTVKLRDNVAKIDGQGRAGGVPVTVTGIVKNPGPELDADFFIKADGISIDSEVLSACPPVVKKVMTELNLRGQGDVWFRAQRPAGPGQRFNLNLAVKLRDSSCSFNGFPYSINRLSGLVLWNGDTVTLKDLKGEHDGAELAAAGRYQRLPAPGRLDLSIQTQNAAFDRALEAALPASLRLVWREFQPKGRFGCETTITWVPGQPCEIGLPSINVANADIQLQSFPWPLQDLKGEFSYNAQQLEMKSFSARHDDTQIHGRGIARFNLNPGEPWHVTFDELYIDDLVPNATFRKALPEQLRLVCESLNPTGKFSVSNARRGPVEIFGPRPPSGNLSAAWDVQMFMAGGAINAGVRVEDIHGRIDLKGSYDGQQTGLSGQLNLDSISIFRQPSGLAHQITHVEGPIQLHEGQFTAGSRAMVLQSKLKTSSPVRVPPSERVVGDAIDGKLTLDAVVDLRAEPDYQAFLTLTQGRLERYAQQYLRGQSDVAGIMNGRMSLSGRGTTAEQIQGRGELHIAPAALYELPLFVQMFRALRLDSPDRTAFDRADLLFNIGNSRFNFETIDLVGNAISLRGRGHVRFDGAMQLDFLSMPPRGQNRFPMIYEFSSKLSRGWVGVKVMGNIGAPQTKVIPVPEFDDAMKQFLGTFDTAPPRSTKTGNTNGPQ
ncbi:MAG: hypothetical protein AABP62_22035 [Planctomycetota bacterium]